MIDKLSLENFTVFQKLTMDFCHGTNLMIGANGTGKTHILKIIYAILAAAKEKVDASEKIIKLFMTEKGHIEHLINRIGHCSVCKAKIRQKGKDSGVDFDNDGAYGSDQNFWDIKIDSLVYIPVKEMLANAPGFRSLYNLREIEFEEIYADILDKAYLPPLRKKLISDDQQKLLYIIEEVLEGKVILKGERFYLKDKYGELEFTLLAEGIRKFALLWLLIRNGSLRKGSILFWDEPEANLNPSLIKTLIGILLNLQKQGVQIFIATHNYIVLKEFDLQKEEENQVRFFSLTRNKESKNIDCQSFDNYIASLPHKISDAYTDLYDREVSRSLGGLK